MWGTEGPASPLPAPLPPVTFSVAMRQASCSLEPAVPHRPPASGRVAERAAASEAGCGAGALVPGLGTGSAPGSPSAPLLPGQAPHQGGPAGPPRSRPGPLCGRPHRSHVALIKAPPCGGRAGSPAGSASAAQVFGFSSRIPSPAWPVLCSRKRQTHKEPANGDSPGSPGPPATPPATGLGCPQGPAREEGAGPGPTGRSATSHRCPDSPALTSPPRGGTVCWVQTPAGRASRPSPLPPPARGILGGTAPSRHLVMGLGSGRVQTGALVIAEVGGSVRGATEPGDLLGGLVSWAAGPGPAPRDQVFQAQEEGRCWASGSRVPSLGTAAPGRGAGSGSVRQSQEQSRDRSGQGDAGPGVESEMARGTWETGTQGQGPCLRGALTKGTVRKGQSQAGRLAQAGDRGAVQEPRDRRAHMGTDRHCGEAGHLASGPGTCTEAVGGRFSNASSCPADRFRHAGGRRRGRASPTPASMPSGGDPPPVQHPASPAAAVHPRPGSRSSLGLSPARLAALA